MSNLKLDFIGIGTGKSATTWIHKCLVEHPGVCVPKVKEVHFFDRHYEEGIEWYEKFFSDCDQEKVIGEYTPGYLFVKNGAELIHKHFPSVKLILCFRNPLDRLVSKYYYEYSRGKTALNIDQRLNELDLEKFLYFKSLQRYLNLFPKEQILVLIYDDIKKDSRSFVRKIYEFLEVDSDFIPDCLEKKTNVTMATTMKLSWLNKFMWKLRNYIRSGRFGKIRVKLMRKIGLDKLAVKLFKLNKKKVNLEKVEKIPPSQETILKIKKHYREDIKNLEKFLNRDLSSWYN